MSDIPRLRIELEGVRATVATMLAHHNDDINKMVISSLNEQLTQEWVQTEIDQAVVQLLRKSISEISSNWELKQAITKLVGEAIAKMVNDK